MSEPTTPTTDQVRAHYVYYAHSMSGDPAPADVYVAEFDRWLRQVQTDAWQKGADTGYDQGHRDGFYSNAYAPPTEGPYADRGQS